MEGRGSPWRFAVLLFVPLGCCLAFFFALGWLGRIETRKTWEEKHLPPVELVRAAVETEAGKATNWKEYPKRILEVRESGPVVVADLVADDSLTKRLVRSEILRDSKAIFRRVFSAYRTPEKLTLVWHAPFRDRFGRESLGPVISISMTRETARKVVWDNVSPEELPAAADLCWEHVKF